MRSTLGRFVVGLAVLVAPAVCQAGTFAPVPASEQQVLALLNQIRQQHHLGSLTASAPLRSAARAHSLDMLRNGYFDHNSASESYQVRISQYVTSPQTGETIARGVGSTGSPVALVSQWMRSAAHRAIILAPTMRRVGLGVAIGSFNGTRNVVMATADFAA
jgi:uncharacterized protein YkwD